MPLKIPRRVSMRVWLAILRGGSRPPRDGVLPGAGGRLGAVPRPPERFGGGALQVLHASQGEALLGRRHAILLLEGHGQLDQVEAGESKILRQPRGAADSSRLDPRDPRHQVANRVFEPPGRRIGGRLPSPQQSLAQDSLPDLAGSGARQVALRPDGVVLDPLLRLQHGIGPAHDGVGAGGILQKKDRMDAIASWSRNSEHAGLAHPRHARQRRLDISRIDVLPFGRDDDVLDPSREW